MSSLSPTGHHTGVGQPPQTHSFLDSIQITVLAAFILLQLYAVSTGLHFRHTAYCGRDLAFHITTSGLLSLTACLGGGVLWGLILHHFRTEEPPEWRRAFIAAGHHITVQERRALHEESSPDSLMAAPNGVGIGSHSSPLYNPVAVLPRLRHAPPPAPLRKATLQHTLYPEFTTWATARSTCPVVCRPEGAPSVDCYRYLSDEVAPPEEDPALTKWDDDDEHTEEEEEEGTPTAMTATTVTATTTTAASAGATTLRQRGPGAPPLPTQPPGPNTTTTYPLNQPTTEPTTAGAAPLSSSAAQAMFRALSLRFADNSIYSQPPKRYLRLTHLVVAMFILGVFTTVCVVAWGGVVVVAGPYALWAVGGAAVEQGGRLGCHPGLYFAAQVVLGGDWALMAVWVGVHWVVMKLQR